MSRYGTRREYTDDGNIFSKTTRPIPILHNPFSYAQCPMKTNISPTEPTGVRSNVGTFAATENCNVTSCARTARAYARGPALPWTGYG